MGIKTFETIYESSKLEESGEWMSDDYNLDDPLNSVASQIKKIMNCNANLNTILTNLKNWVKTGEAGEEKRFVYYLLNICRCIPFDLWRNNEVSEEGKQKAEQIMKICSTLLKNN